MRLSKNNDVERKRLYILAVEALLEACSRNSYQWFIVYELKSESPQMKLLFEILVCLALDHNR